MVQRENYYNSKPSGYIGETAQSNTLVDIGEFSFDDAHGSADQTYVASSPKPSYNTML